MLTANPKNIQGDSITLSHSINNCLNGIIITFSNTSYDYVTGEDNNVNDISYFLNSGYSSLDIKPIKVSKESNNVVSSPFKDATGKNVTFNVNISNDLVTFELNNSDGTSVTEGTHNIIDDEFYAIASITAY